MDIQQIKHQAQSIGIRERTKQSCLRCLHNEPLPRRWKPDNFTIKIKSCALVFDHAYFDEPYFETCCTLFNGSEDVGSYTLMTMLDGTDIDDYLEFY